MAKMGQLSTACLAMGSVSLFATSPAALAARIASTRPALKGEKGGPATVRKKPTPCPQGPVSLTNPAPSLLGHLTKVTVPVARRLTSPHPHHVTQRSNAKLHIQEQDSGASVGIKVSRVGTALLQISLAVSHFVTERAVPAARSVLTRSAHQRERAGAVTTKRRQLLYLKVLVSLTAHVLVLLAPLAPLHVHVAKQWSPLPPVQTKDAPKSGTGWGPVLMCPMRTGHQWMLAST